MSRKGLERQGRGYREHIEGWTCEYTRERFDAGDLLTPKHMWLWVSWRGVTFLGQGWGRTLGAARAAARAVVMERETRGLEQRRLGSMLIESWRCGRMRFRQSVEHGWRWWIQDGDGEPAVDWGHAPTLAKARKAAREVTI